MTDHLAPVTLTAATIDERALVTRLKAGDQDAYEQLVRTLGTRLLVVARRFLRDEDAAADAVQDAFANAFRAMDRFDGHAQLGTWLHRIVVNTCLMRLRRRQRHPEQSLEPLLPCFADDGHHMESVVSWADSAERQLERAQLRRLVREALDELPAAHRALIVMRDMEELSTHEAAHALGISDNALKLRLHRARQALATIMRRKLQAPPARQNGARRGAGAPGQRTPGRRQALSVPPVAMSSAWCGASASHHGAR